MRDGVGRDDGVRVIIPVRRGRGDSSLRNGFSRVGAVLSPGCDAVRIRSRPIDGTGWGRAADGTGGDGAGIRHRHTHAGSRDGLSFRRGGCSDGGRCGEARGG